MALDTFLYTDVLKWGNKLCVRGFQRDTGERKQYEVDFKPFLYVKTNDEAKRVATSLNNEALERMDFDDIRSMETFYDNYKDVDGFKMFGCREIGYQYISSCWPEEKINYDFKHIRGCIIDLEVESGTFDPATGETTKGPFPEPSEANYPITGATIFDSKTKTFFSFGLEYWGDHYIGTWDSAKRHPKIAGCKVMYKGFKTEADLISAIIYVIDYMKPDYMSGWNSETFDTTYLCTRISNVLGNDQLKRLSPWGYVRKRVFTGSFGKDEITYEIKGVANLDYKNLVEKHAYVELANRRLETAGMHFINEGKIAYDGSLTDLYFGGGEVKRSATPVDDMERSKGLRTRLKEELIKRGLKKA